MWLIDWTVSTVCTTIDEQNGDLLFSLPSFLCALAFSLTHSHTHTRCEARYRHSEYNISMCGWMALVQRVCQTWSIYPMGLIHAASFNARTCTQTHTHRHTGTHMHIACILYTCGFVTGGGQTCSEPDNHADTYLLLWNTHVHTHITTTISVTHACRDVCVSLSPLSTSCGRLLRGFISLSSLHYVSLSLPSISINKKTGILSR